MTDKKTLRIIGWSVAAGVGLVLVIQNLEVVRVRLLFADVHLPAILLVLLSSVMGGLAVVLHQKVRRAHRAPADHAPDQRTETS